MTLSILVADDDITNRLVLKTMLVNEGYQVLLADDGRQAVELFEKHHPHIVLMDIVMPGMDGYEATQKIKEQAGEHFTPVIFLTAITDENALANCVTYGGDDFLTKPYNRTLINAKIASMERLRRLYAALKEQKDQLAFHESRLRREHELAENVLANLVQPGCLDAVNIKYLLSPIAIANGDILLATRKPSGAQLIVLGDFTGHGLSAALGALPLSDIFYSMARKGFAMEDIVAEINRKLKLRLPTGLFLSACFLEIDPKRCAISVWNGGLPDLLILDRHQGIKHHLRSTHLPLGIIDNSMFDRSIEIVPIAPGDRIYAYSDGIIEAHNRDGMMFGQTRLEAILNDSTIEKDKLFDTVLDRLSEFQGGVPQEDDTTLIEIICTPLSLGGVCPSEECLLNSAPGPWRMRLELGAETFKMVYPVPFVVQMLTDMQGLQEQRVNLYTIFAELFSNALEHGILKLDSGLKSTPEGFGEYYIQRDYALNQLLQGSVTFDLEHIPLGNQKGRLIIRMEDTGQGFDYKERDLSTCDTRMHESKCGRGIALIRSLCESITFYGQGNRVEAVYAW